MSREQAEESALRDNFAGIALAGVLAAIAQEQPDFIAPAELPRNCAILAYAIADAMMAARRLPPVK